MEAQAGAALLAPTSGTLALLKRMKDKWGTTNAWKEVMTSDSVILKNTNEALFIIGDDIYEFNAGATKIADNVLFEDEVMLKAHASTRQRMRYAIQQHSEKTEMVIRMRQIIAELEKNQARREECVQKIEVKPSPKMRVQHIGVVFLVLFLSYLFTFVGVKAEDCTKPLFGCYVEPGPGAELDWDTFNNVCFGRTTTILTEGNINVDRLNRECVNQTLKLFGHDEYNATARWCAGSIASRVQRRRCTSRPVLAELKRSFEQLKTLVMEMTDGNLHLVTKITAHIALITTSVINAKIPQLVIYYILCIFMNVTLFPATVAMYLFPLETFVFVLIDKTLLQLGVNVTFPIMVSNWVYLTIQRFLTGGDDWMAKVSQAVVTSIGLPVWYVANWMIVEYDLHPIVQMVLFATGLTIMIGTTFATSSYTVVSPDGTVKKFSRISKITNNVRDKLVKMQNAVRGVIPPIPDKTNSVVKIESSVGTGLGFRFMNNILTLGHVVGQDTLVRVTWNKRTVLCRVEKQVDLWESADRLVYIKLAPEFMDLKPLRLTKEPKSDYMSLAVENQNGEYETYSGWVIVDGVWLSNSFETRPGNSGAPYVDRNGRLVGIHMGTQGIMAQGYCLYDQLKPCPQQPTDLKMDPVQHQIEPTRNDLDDLAEKLLSRLIEGTKISHAQITSGLEEINQKLTEEINFLKDRVETLEKTLHQKTQLEDQKKKKKDSGKALFMKLAKVLTEEQYKEMLESGWSKEEIEDAVQTLREAAWLDYETRYDDQDLSDEEIERAIMDQLELQAKKGTHEIKNGVKTQTVMQVVVSEARKRRKIKPFDCPWCKKTYTVYHDMVDCRSRQQVARNEKGLDLTKPKNGQKGRKGTSP
nr:MAG: NSP1a protein [Avian astrovirus 5]